jgi:hypothetical protein
MMASPYARVSKSNWPRTTKRLIGRHPLNPREIVEVVIGAWDAIFQSRIGPKGFQIGRHIFPKPQIMAFFLHELIPLEFATRYPTRWRPERSAGDKDLVYIPDQTLSVEIKTSSHPTQIFGNRSYAQERRSSSKKEKSGFYLAVNFDKFSEDRRAPRVRKIRFGWLDHTDWVGQSAATGQQARLSPETEASKLLTLFESE